MTYTHVTTQKQLLLDNLMDFYKPSSMVIPDKPSNMAIPDKPSNMAIPDKPCLNTTSKTPLQRMMEVINGESKISLRIVDWFVTNYAKKYFTVYEIPKTIHGEPSQTETTRFKVFHEYKLKLKAYAKKNFDPFCRWERIQIPYDENSSMETTIGQLNFFKWAIENHIIDYIQAHYSEIEDDMNSRNSTSKRKTSTANPNQGDDKTTTRKKREELSISACKCIKKENVKIIVKFN